MKPYSWKSIWYEWTTDRKADRKTTKAHKSSERWRTKREIRKAKEEVK